MCVLFRACSVTTHTLVAASSSSTLHLPPHQSLDITDASPVGPLPASSCDANQNYTGTHALLSESLSTSASLL